VGGHEWDATAQLCLRCGLTALALFDSRPSDDILCCRPNAAYQRELARLQQELQHRNDERRQFDVRTYASTSATVWFGDCGSTNRVDSVDAASQLSEDYFRIEAQRRETRAKADDRAVALLEQYIGSDAMAKLLAGGAYPITSKFWPNSVVYYVPKGPSDRIRVVQNGVPIYDSCLVTSNPLLPWADVMLHRIQAIEIDESVVVETGVVTVRQATQRMVPTLRQRFLDAVRGLRTRVA